MANDTSFVLFDPTSPGPVGENAPNSGTFTQLRAFPEASHSSGLTIVVDVPSTHPSPQGALKIEVGSVLDTNPALNIDNDGLGPDIRLAAGITIRKSAGQLVFEDTVAGSVPLNALGGTASNVNVGGVGVFDAKVTGDFQFRGINSLSPRLSVALDAVNKKIDLDVVQSALSITASQISNFSSAVSAHPAVAANTAKVSASGSINTHSDVDLTGIVNGQILSLQGATFKPLTLSAANVSYNDTSTSLGATTVQAAIIALDSAVDALAAVGAEANVGLNINLSGVGVYDSKGGVFLRFRGIAPASGRVSVTHNVGQNTLDLDVVQAALSLTTSQISNFTAAVSAHPAVAANTAKVSASGSINTHSDVDLTGALTDQVLIRNGSGVWVPQDITATRTKFDDTGLNFVATEVQTALEELDALVAINTAKVSATGSIDTHSDVDLAGVAVGHVLQWDGTKFFPTDGSIVRVSFPPVTDNRLVRFDGTTGKLVQQGSVGLSDTGTLSFALAGSSITSSGTFSLLLGAALTVRAGAGTSSFYKHADNTDALEIPALTSQGIIFHTTLRTPTGSDFTEISGKDHVITPAERVIVQAGAGQDTLIRHGDSTIAFRITGTTGLGSDGIIIHSPRVYPGAASTLGHPSVATRQWSAVYAQLFSGGALHNSILRAETTKQVRLESKDLIARVLVDGDSGDVSFNGFTFVNDIFSVFSGVPAGTISPIAGKYQIFVDTDTDELSLRKPSGDLVSLEVPSGLTLMSRGQVEVNTTIPAGTTITASNTTVLPNSVGLQAYSSASEFVAKLFLYLNGQLLTAGESLADNVDAYPAGVAASGQFALTKDLFDGDILQIVKYTEA